MSLLNENINMMKATVNKGFSVNQKLSNFLLTYRSTPHATAGVAPCMLLLKRQLRTRFDLLRPDRARCVESKQAQQKSNHDSRSRQREFVEGRDGSQLTSRRSLCTCDSYFQVGSCDVHGENSGWSELEEAC